MARYVYTQGIRSKALAERLKPERIGQKKLLFCFANAGIILVIPDGSFRISRWFRDSVPRSGALGK